jgi:O-antigen/teichoic acid export membrane protein
VIGRKILLIMVTRVIAAGIAFIALFFISRYLDPDVYGTVVWTLSFVAVFNVVADLGLNSAHIKRVSEGKDLDDCLSTYLVCKLTLIGIMVTIVLVSLWIWTSVLGAQFTETSMEIVLIFILYYVMVDLGQIAITTFNARMQTAKSQISQFFDPLVRMPFIIIVCLGGLSAAHLAYAYLLGMTTFAIVSLLILSRDRLRWKRPTLFRSYLAFALPISAVLILGTVATNIDKLLIGVFWSAEIVGFYGMPQSILSLFGIIGTAVSTLAFPAFSKLFAENNPRAVKRGTVDAERYISMIALPAIIVIVILPLEVATVLLGPNYTESAGPLRFLSISILLVLLNSVYSSQIYALNRPELNARVILVSLIVVIFLLLVLVPQELGGMSLLGLAATGAAMANMFYFLTQFFAFRFITRRLTGVGFNRELLKHAIAGLASAAVVVMLAWWLPLDSWITLVVYGLISWAVFLTVLFLLKGVSRSDIQYVLDVVNLRRMIGYIKDEFKKED